MPKSYRLLEPLRRRLSEIIGHLAKLAGGRTAPNIEITSADEIGFLEQALSETILNQKSIRDPSETIVVHRDITKETRAKEALREAKDYTDSILSSMTDMLVVVSPDGRIVTVNQAACDLLGYPKDELLGQPATLLFAEEEDDADTAQPTLSQHALPVKRTVFRRLVRDGSVGNVEKSLLTKCGDRIPVLLSGSVMFDDERKVRGIVCLALDITKRKQMEDALRASQGKLNAMLASVPDHISMMDKDLNIVWANEVATRTFGDELVGKKCYQAYHGRETPCEPYPCLTLQAFEDGRPHAHETQVIDKEGKTHCFHCTAAVALRDEDANPTAVIEISRDITDRKKSQEVLWESQERARALIQNTILGVAIMDTDYRIIMVNPTLAGLFERPPSSFVGKHCFREFEKRDAVCAHCPGARAMVSGKTEQVETQGVRDDGSRFYAHNRAAPLFARDGTLRGFIEMVEDIDARKKAEEAVIKSEDRYRASITLTRQLAWITNASGEVVEDIPHWRAFTGQSYEETKGQGWMEALHPDDVERATEVWMNALQTKSGYETEYRVRRSDGVYRDFLTRGVPVLEEDGSIREWVGVCIDITERKRAEEELAKAKEGAEAATRAKSCFLANMSHEIRTPMTAILGFTDLLLKDLKQPEFLDTAHIIKRNGEHLLQIINDILDISKIEAGKVEADMICWSPRQIIAECVSLLHVRAKAKGLTLADEYPGPMPETIITDPSRLRQILVNLVGNAIKFTETGGVRIVTRLIDGHEGEPQLQFDVIDTGVGIPKEKIENLFEPFTQADDSNSRRFEGTGLGLAISRQLAHLLGGDIIAKSELNKGSTFTLTIATGPLDGVRLVEYLTEPPATVEQPVELAGESQQKLQCRVLLAEDVPDNQRLVTALLSEAGAEVTIAQNGVEAVEKALATSPGWGRRYSDPTEPFDVILMDIQMPVLDGHEATRRLRAQGYTGPIIALTAHAMRGDHLKCLDAGCDDYLAKPIDRQKLLETVAKWLTRQREQTEVAVGNEPHGEGIEEARE